MAPVTASGKLLNVMKHRKKKVVLKYETKALSVTGLGVGESSICSSLMQAGETYLGITFCVGGKRNIQRCKKSYGWMVEYAGTHG